MPTTASVSTPITLFMVTLGTFSTVQSMHGIASKEKQTKYQTKGKL